MRVRAEAKRQGAPLGHYHLISNATLVTPIIVTPSQRLGNENSIVLLTQYRSMAGYLEREKLLAAIGEHGVFTRLQPENLYGGPNNRRMTIRSEAVMDRRVFSGRTERKPAAATQASDQAVGLRSSRQFLMRLCLWRCFDSISSPT